MRILLCPQADATLDELSREDLKNSGDRTAERNVQILNLYAEREPAGKSRKIIMRFLVSPVEIIGDEKVSAIKIVKNELYQNERGTLRPRATEEFETIPVEMVFRSVGYRGVALPDVPFYEQWGTIPNDKGRVLTEHESDEQVIGDYVVGWIKRGPTGIIGTNRPDAIETVKMFLEDLANGKVLEPEDTSIEGVMRLIESRQPNYVTFADWEKIKCNRTSTWARNGAKSGQIYAHRRYAV